MKYYAQYDKDNLLIAVGINCGGIEIAENDYNELLITIGEKLQLVNKLYNNEITIDDVPIDWREEIQKRVDEKVALQGTIDEQELSSNEALNIILGG